MTNPSVATPETGGRSLKMSVIVGLLLGGAFLASILIYPPAFMVLAALAAGSGAWELSTAMRIKGWHVPRIPITVGSVLIMPMTFFFGSEGQWLDALITVAALILWRVAQLIWDPAARNRTASETVSDFAASAFVVIYLPLMTSFGILLLKHTPHGQGWVVTYITTVSMIDTFGYLVGRKLGRHKIAPGVSPKKSLEGLIASIVAGTVVAVSGSLILDRGWLFGIVFAAAMLIAAVFGDLAESLIKRDLGVKDMSSWLPGHGGVMDRLDSILPATLIAYLLISLPVPF
jgi:phosphatidate cytidylyltransferase